MSARDFDPDARFMAAALALARRGAGRTGANPNVGCLIVRDGVVVGRGWTADGGRPHAEAMALVEAGRAAHGADCYVTLEPCAHESTRGPACADILIAAGVGRVCVAMPDPDPRTAGAGIARMERSGVRVVPDVLRAAAEAELAGFSGRLLHGRPELTLKLALSLDGRLATARRESQWITGPIARLYAHFLRARADLVVVGSGTYTIDRPRLDVRIPGYGGPQPARAVIGGAGEPPFLTFESLAALDRYAFDHGVNRILCEGGGGLAATLLAVDRVDRLILLRAPIVIGAGIGLEAFQPADLAGTHDRWDLEDRRQLGADVLEVYGRRR